MNDKALNEIIQAQIRQKQGFISFAEFMNLALYAPKWGYYNSQVRLGTKGDFITAPEISPLFGHCIATAIAPVIRDLEESVIIEFGPGSGKLAASILKSLQKIEILPKNYYLIEVSAMLRAEQQTTLENLVPELMSKIVWLDRLPSEPVIGVIIANEVLDAMPVERFSLHDREIWQMGVAENYEWAYRIAPEHFKEAVMNAVPYFSDIKAPYQSEIQLHLLPWLNSVNDFLQQGMVLLIDYGFEAKTYYHPDRDQGTLMCHYQQRAHPNPFLHIGKQDITAHVNFTEVAKAADIAGFEVAGYTNQAYFLLDTNLLDTVLEITDPQEHFLAQQAVKLLTLPQEMGELFKVMMLGKNYQTSNTGFRLRDLRYKLA